MKNTRETIVNVACNLFLKKNFKEVTIKEIVDNAGVSQGAFFHYFKSKEQLFLEIVENAFHSAVDAHYNKLSKQTLYQFYHDYLNWFINSPYVQKPSVENGLGENDDHGEDLHLNYFSLFFDALKLFPAFHEKLLESQQIELDIWTNVGQTARRNG
jgi:TetR/AcrR family transcriptional regulator, transcriptional repressor for nem operon